MIVTHCCSAGVRFQLLGEVLRGIGGVPQLELGDSIDSPRSLYVQAFKSLSPTRGATGNQDLKIFPSRCLKPLEIYTVKRGRRPVFAVGEC